MSRDILMLESSDIARGVPVVDTIGIDLNSIKLEHLDPHCTTLSFDILSANRGDCLGSMTVYDYKVELWQGSSFVNSWYMGDGDTFNMITQVLGDMGVKLP